MTETTLLPYNFVVDARDNAAWNTLGYWVWLRASFQRKIYYNYTCRRIGKILGVSQGTAAHHLNVMKKLGWVYEQDGHLFIPPMKKFNRDSIIKVAIHSHRQAQTDELKRIPIINNLFTQGKRIEKKKKVLMKSCTIRGKVSKSEYKMVSKAGGFKKLELSLNDYTTLSNSTIGNIFSASKRTGSRLQVRLNNMGLIKSEAVYERVNVDFFALPSNVFLYRGKHYVRRRSNRIISTTQ